MRYKGGCHCGRVRFEIEAPNFLDCLNCNCSICAKTGYLHYIVPQSRFHLLSGSDAVASYTFNTGVATHTFCKTCGVKSFYKPRSNPDGISVNVKCLEPFPGNIRVRVFDGQNWEANAPKIAHLSKETEDLM